MTVVIMFFALIAGLAGWWLARQRLTVKPWLEQGVIGDVPNLALSRDPAKRAALGFLLAVVGSLFALVTGAYFMRREFGDWQSLPVPGILWFNTAALVASSIALEWTQISVRRQDLWRTRVGLVLAGMAALIFLGGQLLAWQELVASGYYVAANPANSFYYLATGLHGLHIIGGFVALTWTTSRAWRSDSAEDVRLAVELSATYWLFMLFVWMVLFSLVAGWASEFIQLCAELLT